MDREKQNRIFVSLARSDSSLRSLIKRYAPLEFYDKKPHPPFHTLVSMIINQQLSQKAANTIQNRLLVRQGGRYFSARKLSTIQDLRQYGLSQQKQKYVHGLIQSTISGRLNFTKLRKQANEDVRDQLMSLPGIGAWTADVFLLANFHREDVFPAGDLILQKFMQGHFSLPLNSKPADYAKFAQRWQPHRSLVSLLFWKAANTSL